MKAIASMHRMADSFCLQLNFIQQSYLCWKQSKKILVCSVYCQNQTGNVTYNGLTRQFTRYGKVLTNLQYVMATAGRAKLVPIRPLLVQDPPGYPYFIDPQTKNYVPYFGTQHHHFWSTSPLIEVTWRLLNFLPGWNTGKAAVKFKFADHHQGWKPSTEYTIAANWRYQFLQMYDW